MSLPFGPNARPLAGAMPGAPTDVSRSTSEHPDPSCGRDRSITGRPLLGMLVGLLVVAAGGMFVANAQTRLGVVSLDLGLGAYFAFYTSLLAVHAGGFWLWKRFASRHGVARSTRDALMDAGLMTVGKYFPGKIWGLLGRGAFEGSRLTLNARRVAVSTAEQLVVLWSGALAVAAVMGIRPS